jgi:uncharacterized protein YpmB
LNNIGIICIILIIFILIILLSSHRPNKSLEPCMSLWP